MIQNHALLDRQCLVSGSLDNKPIYLTNPSPKPTDSSIKTNDTHNTHTSPMHTPNTYLPHSRISVHPNRPSPIISTEAVIIPVRTNNIKTTPSALPCSENCSFKSWQQHFIDQPVQYTPVIINVENENFPVNFINHSDREVVIPKDSYVEAMEEVQESDQDISHTNTSAEPVSQHTLSKCLVQSDFLPNQHQQVHCITNSTSTITIPTSTIYRPDQLLLNKKAYWMTIFILITAVAVTAVAYHTHYHFKPPFKEPDKPIVSPARTLTSKELLAYGTLVRLKTRLQPARSEKTSQIHFFDWTLPPVLAKRLHISNHLVLAVYNPISPQDASLIQTVTHTRCHFAMKVRECPRPLKDPNTPP